MLTPSWHPLSPLTPGCLPLLLSPLTPTRLEPLGLTINVLYPDLKESWSAVSRGPCRPSLCTPPCPGPGQWPSRAGPLCSHPLASRWACRHLETQVEGERGQGKTLAGSFLQGRGPCSSQWAGQAAPPSHRSPWGSSTLAALSWALAATRALVLVSSLHYPPGSSLLKGFKGIQGTPAWLCQRLSPGLPRTLGKTPEVVRSGASGGPCPKEVRPLYCIS